MFRDEPRFAFALQALNRREFERAQSAFDELLTPESLGADERAFLLNKRGVARIGLKLRELARADFAAALQARAAYAPALTNLGNLSLEEGDLDTAIARYESAIRSDAGYAIAYLNLGVAYKRAGRIDDGVRALRQAQRLEQRANAAGGWRRARRR